MHPLIVGYAPSPNRSRRTAAGNDDSFPLDNSLVDLGDDQQDYSDDGAGPSAGRQSLSVVSPIGRGRNRPSGAGSLRDQSASRRQSGRSSFDVNNDSLDRSADMPMMDDEIPSFNVDANDEEAAEAALGSGDEVEDGVQVDHNAGAAGLDGTGAGKAERASARRGKKGEKGAMRVERTERAGSGPLSAKDREIKEKVPRSRGGSVIEGDVRRSTRHRYTPLEYWRGERAIYGRASVRLGGSRHRVRDSAEQDGADETAGDDTIEADAFEDAPIKSYAVPVLREVIRIRRDVDEGTFSGLKIKRKGINGSKGRPVKRTVKRKRSRKADGESDDEDDGEVDPTQPTRHPEEGWDEATDPHGMVWDVERQSEVERRIACPISQVRPKTAINSDFAFEKVFGVDDYMAAGILEIPVGGGKPSKPTKDNNYVSGANGLFTALTRFASLLTRNRVTSSPLLHTDLCRPRRSRRCPSAPYKVHNCPRRNVHGPKGQRLLDPQPMPASLSHLLCPSPASATPQGYRGNQERGHPGSGTWCCSSWSWWGC